MVHRPMRKDDIKPAYFNNGEFWHDLLSDGDSNVVEVSIILKVVESLKKQICKVWWNDIRNEKVMYCKTSVAEDHPKILDDAITQCTICYHVDDAFKALKQTEER